MNSIDIFFVIFLRKLRNFNFLRLRDNRPRPLQRATRWPRRHCCRCHRVCIRLHIHCLKRSLRRLCRLYLNMGRDRIRMVTKLYFFVVSTASAVMLCAFIINRDKVHHVVGLGGGTAPSSAHDTRHAGLGWNILGNRQRQNLLRFFRIRIFKGRFVRVGRNVVNRAAFAARE